MVELHITLATPDSASDTVPVTVIAAFVTTLPFTGEAIEMTGGVLSRFTVALAVAELPA
jgi:hypothetical protein